MDPLKKLGWNREIHSQRYAASSSRMKISKLTDAEFYLTVGRIVLKRIRSGSDAEGYARRAKMSVDTCCLSANYASSPTDLIFRALMEDWSWNRIKEELRQRRIKQGG